MREWLLELDPADRRVVGFDIATVEFGWPLGMPICKPLGGGLWETRSSLSGNRIARVIFCLAADRMVLLHGFVQKTQKTAQADIDMARRRQRNLK